MSASLAEFRAAYAAHRAAEGRAYGRAELLALPYLATGPLARQWAVRARTYEAFVRWVLLPMVGGRDSGIGDREPGRHSRGGGNPSQHSRLTPGRSGGATTMDPRLRGDDERIPLRVLDLGAGNGWLSWRAAQLGCDAVAVDLRDDAVDGLGAAGPYVEDAGERLTRVAASFDALPLADASFDVTVFDASLHYATDLAAALREARRVTRRGGRVVVLDSPVYARDADGAAMVAEKRRDAAARFGERAGVLLGRPAVEYLTRARLAAASSALGLTTWRRERVLYPLWYELRPLVARLRGRRAPSRFDLWESTAA